MPPGWGQAFALHFETNKRKGRDYMKKRLIIPIVVAVIIVTAISIISIPSVFATLRQEARKQEYEKALQDQAVQYLEIAIDGFEKEEWTFAGMRASDKSENALSNDDNDTYVYPYDRVEIYFAPRHGSAGEGRITVFLERNNSGMHEVVDYRNDSHQ